MKRFTKKLIAFLGIFAVLLLTFDLLSATERFRGVFATLTDSSDYEEGAEREVTAYLAKSRTPGSYTKLLVGDSVCAQMTEAFFDCNQQYCLVGNNRALTMAGEYLLVKEFLETHENVSEVWLMTGPDLLQTSIDATYSYSYVVLPFLQADLLGELDEETAEEMEETFGSFFLKKPVAELIAGSAVNRKLYLNYVKEREEALEKGESRENQTVGMSDLAERYLRKIYELCDAQGVACYLIPDPLADTPARRKQVEQIRQDFETRGLERLFPDYFSEITYYPADQFSDGIHFGRPYNTKEVYREKLRELYLDRGYLDGFQI